MSENPAGIFSIAALLIGLIVAIAWTVLPFILFSRLKSMEKLLASIDVALTSVDRRLYYFQTRFEKADGTIAPE